MMIYKWSLNRLVINIGLIKEPAKLKTLRRSWMHSNRIRLGWILIWCRRHISSFWVTKRNTTRTISYTFWRSAEPSRIQASSRWRSGFTSSGLLRWRTSTGTTKIALVGAWLTFVLANRLLIGHHAKRTRIEVPPNILLNLSGVQKISWNPNLEMRQA